MRRLLAKDAWEQIKTYRLLIAGILFLVFGLTAPVLMKMLPHMMPKASTGGVQFRVTGEATLADAARQFLQFIGQMGVLIIIILGMGTFAGEKARRISSMVLTKPVSRTSYALSKYIVQGSVFIVCIVVSSFAFYGYSVAVYGSYPVVGVPLMLVCACAFVLFVVAVTLLMSALVKSSFAAGGLALIAVFGLTVVPGFFAPVKRFGPGYLLEAAGNVLARTSGFGPVVASLVISLCLIGVLLTAAVLVFGYKDI